MSPRWRHIGPSPASDPRVDDEVFSEGSGLVEEFGGIGTEDVGEGRCG
jgi:hypothetical protein